MITKMIKKNKIAYRIIHIYDNLAHLKLYNF